MSGKEEKSRQTRVGGYKRCVEVEALFFKKAGVPDDKLEKIEWTWKKMSLLTQRWPRAKTLVVRRWTNISRGRARPSFEANEAKGSGRLLELLTTLIT